jgi:hypothetical protein
MKRAELGINEVVKEDKAQSAIARLPQLVCCFPSTQIQSVSNDTEPI